MQADSAPAVDGALARDFTLEEYPSSQERRVRFFVDESKPQPKHHPKGESWLYIGILGIPEASLASAAMRLRAARERASGGYDGEIHFEKIKDGRKKRVASAWLDEVLHDATSTFHFHVLGINMDMLNVDAFGDDDGTQRRRIYSRFVRSALAYAARSFFPHDDVQVTDVVHDRTQEMEDDAWFDWHVPYATARDNGVRFDSPRLAFADSDHRREDLRPDDSRLVQLVDVILGSVRQCLDCPSIRPEALELGDKMLPLMHRIMSGRRNVNSSYHYVNRCSVSFFPSSPLSLEELDDAAARARSGFVRRREMLLETRHQLALF